MSDETIRAVGRIRLRGLALLVIAFVTGGLAGAAVEHLRTPDPSPPGPTAGPRRVAPPMATGPEDTVPPVFEQLDLTEDQREEILRILRESRTMTDSLLAPVMPRLRAVTDSVRREIRDVLSPEQRERLEREFPAFRGAPGPRGIVPRGRR